MESKSGIIFFLLRKITKEMGPCTTTPSAAAVVVIVVIIIIVVFVNNYLPKWR